MNFEFFDPAEELVITSRNLPHWYQPGVTYFITFRTADSLPTAVLKQWLQDRGDWLSRHGIDITNPNWQAVLQQLPSAVRHEFHSRFTEQFHRLLDAGHGECLLRRPELAQIVAQSLIHFDGTRYLMGDFVVMPNHVHLLVCLLGQTELIQQCYAWKKFTAGQIHQALGRHGHFWQGESFDHLVRSEEQFEYFRLYIAENPKKAGLKEGEYFLCQRPM